MGNPNFTLTEVDELPPHPKNNRGRDPMYLEALQVIQAMTAKHGKWFEVARYKSRSGASDSWRAIRNGDRAVPPGQWEFETRIFEGGNGSALYARFLGDTEN